MIYIIEINIDNAAFDPADIEVKRILNGLANQIESATGEDWEKGLYDFNGNRVGKAELIED